MVREWLAVPAIGGRRWQGRKGRGWARTPAAPRAAGRVEGWQPGRRDSNLHSKKTHAGKEGLDAHAQRAGPPLLARSGHEGTLAWRRAAATGRWRPRLHVDRHAGNFNNMVAAILEPVLVFVNILLQDRAPNSQKIKSADFSILRLLAKSTCHKVNG